MKIKICQLYIFFLKFSELHLFCRILKFSTSSSLLAVIIIQIKPRYPESLEKKQTNNETEGNNVQHNEE